MADPNALPDFETTPEAGEPTTAETAVEWETEDGGDITLDGEPVEETSDDDSEDSESEE